MLVLMLIYYNYKKGPFASGSISLGECFWKLSGNGMKNA